MKKVIAGLCALGLVFSAGESLSAVDFSIGASAQTLGLSNAKTVSPTQKITDSITSQTTQRIYKVTLSGAGKLTAQVRSSAVDNVYFKLYDSTGTNQLKSKYIYSSGATGQLAEDIVLPLNKGTYYIVMDGSSYHTGEYTLNLSFSNAGESFAEATNGSNNTFESANTISLNKTYKGYLSLTDTQDAYKVTLPSSGKVEFSYTAKYKYSYVYIYSASDITKELKYSYSTYSDATGLAKASEKYYLNKGTYYIVVKAASYADDIDDLGYYTFKTKFTSAGETFAEKGSGSNNTMSTANAISLNKSYKGMLGLNDEKDIYKFTVKNSKGVNINFSSIAKYPDIELYDKNGDKVSGVYLYTTESTLSGKYVINNKHLDIDKGTYYLVIGRGSASSSDYHGSYSISVNGEKLAQKVTVANTNIKKADGAKAFSLGATASGGGKLTYKSSDTSVATVSSTGKVTIKGPGKATIKVTAAATSTYNAAAKKVTITVSPKKVGITAVSSPAKGQIKATWAKNSKATGYVLKVCSNSKFSGAKKIYITSNKTTAKKVTGLTSGKTYYVKICTYKKVGSSKIVSGWSATKTVKCK